jgi:hypothetical protein
MKAAFLFISIGFLMACGEEGVEQISEHTLGSQPLEYCGSGRMDDSLLPVATHYTKFDGDSGDVLEEAQLEARDTTIQFHVNGDYIWSYYQAASENPSGTYLTCAGTYRRFDSPQNGLTKPLADPPGSPPPSNPQTYYHIAGQAIASGVIGGSCPMHPALIDGNRQINDPFGCVRNSSGAYLNPAQCHLMWSGGNLYVAGARQTVTDGYGHMIATSLFKYSWCF